MIIRAFEMRNIVFLILLFFVQSSYAKEDSLKVKKDWNLGIVPAVAFDQDRGFEYGVITNLYYYGDGSVYPEYLHSLYFEVSRYTKGTGINRFYYDSKYLIPDIRLTFDLSYLTENALNFYGFNGYSSVYNYEWINEEDDNYISRLFYAHERSVFRLKNDFQGKFSASDFGWLAGFAYYDYNIGEIDVDLINKGKDNEDKIPDTTTLYQNYVDWGVISPQTKNGGEFLTFNAGLTYDSRINIYNPMSGMWSELIFRYGIPLNNSFEKPFLQIAAIQRQYFTILPKKLSFVYRIGYQGLLANEVPWYFKPNIITSYFTGATSEGLGGSKTIRGVLRNRIVGDNFVFSNIELRWRIVDFSFINQNFYIGTNMFFDAGRTVGKNSVENSNIPDNEYARYFSDDGERFHFASGAGLKIAMNENFIGSADYGFAFDKQDGTSGLYISLNYLF